MFILFKSLFRLVARGMRKADARKHRSQKDKYEDVTVTEYSYLAGGAKEHRIDIIKKIGSQKQPLLFDVHGGGWFYGEKDLNRAYACYFARAGYTVAVPSYNLVLSRPMKQTITDVQRALQFVIENAKKFNIDTEQIFITSDSAGAAIVTILLAVSQSAELQRLYQLPPLQVSIRGLVFTHPVVQISEMLSSSLKPGHFQNIAVKTFFRMMYGKKFECNPLYRNSSFEDIKPFIKYWPPTMITTSTGDKAFYHLAMQFYRDIQGFNNIRAPLVAGDNFIHVQNILLPEEAESRFVNDQVKVFLDEIYCLGSSSSEKTADIK